MEKMFSVLLTFTFFSPNHIFLIPPPPLAESNLQNTHTHLQTYQGLISIM